MNRLDAIKNYPIEGKKALVVRLVAGAPEVAISKRFINELSESVDAIIMEIPSVTSILGSPSAVAASAKAASSGVTPYRVVGLIRELRRTINTPLVASGYLNNLISYGYKYGNDYDGTERFITEAKLAGLDGLIINDLPYEEGANVRQICLRKGICLIQSVTPLSSLERMTKISEGAAGFIQCYSPAALSMNETIESLKTVTKIPVLAEVNTTVPEEVRELVQISDGIIIGDILTEKLVTSSYDEAIELIKNAKLKMQN